jgi:hypothetical protein
MKLTIEIPPGLAARLHALKQRVAQGEAAGERLVEIAVLTRGLDALERQHAPALVGSIEPKTATKR